MYHFSPSEVSALKRQAKVFKKKASCSLSHAQQYVARVNGYDNWSLLQKHALKKDDPRRPARIFMTEDLTKGIKVQNIRAIRSAPDGNSTDANPGSLYYRCPFCHEVHTQDASTEMFGSGDGISMPTCMTTEDRTFLYINECLEPAWAGHLPPEVLAGYAPLRGDDHIFAWFGRHHESAIERSPYETKEGGYIYPTMDGANDIHDVLCGAFDEVDEEHLFRLAEIMDENGGPWLTSEFMVAQEMDLIIDFYEREYIEPTAN